MATLPYTEPKNMPLDGPGITTKVAREKTSILIEDITDSPDYVFGGIKASSELAVPAISRGEPVAVLNVESPEISAFDETDQKLLEIFSEHVAAAFTRLEYQETLVELEKERIRLENAGRMDEIKKIDLSALL
jgi:GAF domain-containing protein